MPLSIYLFMLMIRTELCGKSNNYQTTPKEESTVQAASKCKGRLRGSHLTVLTPEI